MSGRTRVAAALSVVLAAACQHATSPDPSGTTVTGTVVDDYFVPQGRVVVFIPGRDVVTTDDAGRFSVSGVTPPYDLYVAMKGAVRAAVGYVGLTRDDVLVTIPPHESSGWPHQSSVSGALSGGYAWGDTFGVSILFDSPETSRAITRSPQQGPYDSYGLGFSWAGPATTVGTLHALEWRLDGQTGLVDEYRYAELADVAVADGSPTGDQDLAFAAVPMSSIAGSVTAPDAYTVSRKTLSAAFRDSQQAVKAWSIEAVDGADAAFSFVAPLLPGGRFAVTARAGAGDAYSEAIVSGLAAGTGNVAVDIPPAPALGDPQDGFSGVDLSTRFTWSRTQGAVYMVSFEYAGSELVYPAPPALYIFTADTTLTLPDLRPMNLGFQMGTLYVWGITAYAPVPSTDAVMTETWFLPQADGSTAYSGTHGFWFVK